jgi:hypothetical protein
MEDGFTWSSTQRRQHGRQRSRHRPRRAGGPVDTTACVVLRRLARPARDSPQSPEDRGQPLSRQTVPACLPLDVQGV